MKASAITACILLCAAAASLTHAGEISVDLRDLQGNPLTDGVIFAEPVGGAPSPVQMPRATIDQVNKQFVPRISVLRTGTEVIFPNSDNIRHSVYSFSAAKVFTTKLYAGKQAPPITFDKSGVVVLGCNIHDQMLAWVVVVDTPHFVKSGVDGAGVLKGLPAGEYRLNAWYPGLDQPKTETVRVPGEGQLTRQMRIDASSSPLPKAQT
jgi:plastocyanin